MDDIPLKQCNKCKEVKIQTEFVRDSKRKTGYRSYCKDCERLAKGYTKREVFPPGVKRCSKCKEIKPLAEFHHRSSEKSSYAYACKVCDRARRGYKKREEFPSGMKQCAKCKAMLPLDQFFPRSDQPGKVRAHCKSCTSKNASEYNTTHRDERNKKGMEYYFAHPERFREYSKKYLLAHPQLGAQYCRKSYEKHRARRTAARRDYYQRNAMLERSRQAQRRVIESQGDADYATIWERDGGICHICGKEVDLKDLHFDHVKPVIRGGLHTMENVKVSHAKCNKSKGAKSMDEYRKWLESSG